MSLIKIKKDDLGILFKELSLAFSIIGPKIESETIIFSEIQWSDIPFHVTDIHGQGYYRLSDKKIDNFFSFSSGPDSFKRFLFPPEQELFKWKYNRKSLNIEYLYSNEKPVIIFGLRACDISALKLYDKIFFEDKYYAMKRKNCLIIAVNCVKPTDNCFCFSMNTGPEVKEADAIITELKRYFLIEINSEKIMSFVDNLSWTEPQPEDIKEKEEILNNCRNNFKKGIDKRAFKNLFKKIEDPIWDHISERDLECGNCTQVCPTCFCNSTYDRVKLNSISKADIRGKRIRTWDSCFSRNFARVHGGNFRPSRRARYRHWFMHKFFYMEEQFGLPGCVGCGRCITWCPAGIDVTEILGRLLK